MYIDGVDPVTLSNFTLGISDRISILHYTLPFLDVEKGHFVSSRNVGSCSKGDSVNFQNATLWQGLESHCHIVTICDSDKFLCHYFSRSAFMASVMPLVQIASRSSLTISSSPSTVLRSIPHQLSMPRISDATVAAFFPLQQYSLE